MARGLCYSPCTLVESRTQTFFFGESRSSTAACTGLFSKKEKLTACFYIHTDLSTPRGNLGFLLGLRWGKHATQFQWSLCRILPREDSSTAGGCCSPYTLPIFFAAYCCTSLFSKKIYSVCFYRHNQLSTRRGTVGFPLGLRWGKYATQIICCLLLSICKFTSRGQQHGGGVILRILSVFLFERCGYCCTLGAGPTMATSKVRASQGQHP